MKIFGRTISIPIQVELPVIGIEYYHKDKDPYDMIAYVIPQKVEGNFVTYAKVYKDSRMKMKVQRETITLAEFQRWFRRV